MSLQKEDLEELVLHDTDGTSIINYLKSINILSVIEIAAACWDEIQVKTLHLSWRKIIPLEEDQNSNEENTVNTNDSPAYLKPL